MNTQKLAIYMNDHLAGSVAALELLRTLTLTPLEPTLRSFLARLQSEVSADRDELEAIMRTLKLEQSTLRKITAWVVEKISEIKLQANDFSHGSLGLLESLEILSIGIEGKHSLWRSMSATAAISPSLQVADYERLAKRAMAQRQELEIHRLEAARKALRST